ncbi:uncharacterized protein P174DRAFT_376583 [Aspergillus novofumigatus IBT 16806]|uniref:Aminoglycoside phosphotransferase domain-containing protein n=1 Tax=Aspergillus novofumigatus (strain IBT 16806) TaxID=1392255 RepID=A0A2I1C0M9_ASPN1|nr:uncharacterized protein P174DRAFT_376583 [Aspergillus novofumigatus IBT 16806]PKX91188.1 hypothetical protein P174DRAFT_376583 [Aspergillus novofumigatus IBT 16806]
MANSKGPIRLTPSMIPNSPNFDVKDSSFFQKYQELPSPEDVQAQAEAQRLAGFNPNPRKDYQSAVPYFIKPQPAVFENMNLLVKWGLTEHISEAQTLFALRRLLNGLVPVPEVYGWRTDGVVKYIYMECIRGQTLEQAWDKLEPDDKVSISRELRTICDNLHRLEQGPSDPFVGMHTAPYSFHDWFAFLRRRPMPDPYSVPIESYRYELPDDCAIKFTHGDLHRSNIVISSSRPYRTLAIVDWEQSGWFPAYWEARKAQYTAWITEEWSTTYLPMILDMCPGTLESWNYYTISIGP